MKRKFYVAHVNGFTLMEGIAYRYTGCFPYKTKTGVYLYRITHIPTGLRICTLSDRSLVLPCMREMEKLKLSNPTYRLSEEKQLAVTEICCKFHAQFKLSNDMEICFPNHDEEMKFIPSVALASFVG